MKRRNALKGMVLFALGTHIVYSCKDKYQAIKSLPLSNLPLEDRDITLIENLSTRILPIANIENLKNHTTTPFVLTMANDCLSPEEKEKFVNGYQSFEAYTVEKTGKSLKSLTDEEFSLLMTGMDATNPSPVSFFIQFVRDKNIQYLTTSEHFLTTYREYEMAPGFYNGCVPIS